MTPQERMETIRSLAAQLADLVDWSDDVLSVYIVRRGSRRYSIHVVDAGTYGKPEVIGRRDGDWVWRTAYVRLPDGGEILQSMGGELVAK